MAADLNKNGVCHFFQNAVTPEIMVGIAPYLVHRGDLGRPFDFSRFGLGVTSRDLSMTLPVLQTFLCKCPLAPKLLGLEWSNLGKS